jgi:hypothetical protein
MKARGLVFWTLAVVACGCTGDPGVNAPSDPPVTAAKINSMSPAQRAAYNQAMMSRDLALAATQGKGPLAHEGNGR